MEGIVQMDADRKDPQTGPEKKPDKYLAPLSFQPGSVYFGQDLFYAQAPCPGKEYDQGIPANAYVC
jgi:hypothetical protein